MADGELRWNEQEQRWEPGGATGWPPAAPRAAAPPPAPVTEPGPPPGPFPPAPPAPPTPPGSPGGAVGPDAAGFEAHPPTYTDGAPGFPHAGPGAGLPPQHIWESPAHPASPAHNPAGTRPWHARPAVRVGAVLLSFVVLGGVIGGVLAVRGGEGDDKNTAAEKSDPAPPPTGPAGDGAATDPPTESASPSDSPSGPPEGWSAVSEPEFTAAVPDGWERRTQTGEKGVTVYFYEEPGSAGRIQVFPVTEDEATPLGTLELAESYIDGGTYSRNALDEVDDDPRGPAAELDYSHDSEEFDVRMRTLDRVVTGPDGTLYAVLVAAPEDDWPQQQETQADFLDTLCFTGGEC